MIRNICNKYKVYQKKIFVTSSVYKGNNIITSMNLQGISFLNLHVETPYTVLKNLALNYFQEEINLLPPDIKDMALLQILLNRLNKKELDYFKNIEAPLDFINALSDFFSNLRYFGIDLENLNPDFFMQKNKGKNLILLYKDYLEWLKKNNYLDVESLFCFVKDKLKNCGPINDDVYIILEEDKHNKDFLDIISKITSTEVECIIKSVTPRHRDTVTPDFNLSRSPYEEVDDILKYINLKQIPFDKVEIICSDFNKYSSIIYQSSAKNHINCSFENGMPIINFDAGKLVYLYIKFLKSDFNSNILISLIESGFFKFENKEETISYLKALKIGWSKPRYSSVDFAEKLFSFFDFKSSENIVQFIQEYFIAINDREKNAKDKLINKLLELDIKDIDKDIILKKIESMLINQNIMQESAKPGSIYVSSYDSGGNTSREHVFFIGLNYDYIPGKESRNSIILDEEKINISERFKEIEFKPSHRINKLRAAVDKQSGKIYFSASYYDKTKTDSFQLITPVLLEYSQLNYKNFKQKYFLALNKIVEESLEYKNIFDVYPNLKQGQIAYDKRHSQALSEYDGLLTEFKSEFDPRYTKKPISATKIEQISDCAFKYFIENILKLRTNDRVSFDLDKWMTPLQKGSLVHNILFEYLSLSRDVIYYVPTKKDLLDKIIKSNLEEYHKSTPPYPKEIIEKELFYLQHVFDSFYNFEHARQDKRKPYKLELGFGGESKEHTAIKIALKDEDFLLSGKIDRIDITDDDTCVVIDYKTGKPVKYSPDEKYKKGARLQPFLYSYALKKLLGKDVKKAGYYYIPSNGFPKEVLIEVSNVGELKELLDNIFDIVKEGLFISNRDMFDEHSTCNYCDYSGYCKIYEDDEALARKERPAYVDRLGEFK